MKYTVYAAARVEADSPGAAEEIALYEEVKWEVRRGSWARRGASRAAAAIGLGWMATAPWGDYGVSLFGEHVARALAPIGMVIALVTS